MTYTTHKRYVTALKCVYDDASWKRYRLAVIILKDQARWLAKGPGCFAGVAQGIPLQAIFNLNCFSFDFACLGHVQLFIVVLVCVIYFCARSSRAF